MRGVLLLLLLAGDVGCESEVVQGAETVGECSGEDVRNAAVRPELLRSGHLGVEVVGAEELCPRLCYLNHECEASLHSKGVCSLYSRAIPFADMHWVPGAVVWNKIRCKELHGPAQGIAEELGASAAAVGEGLLEKAASAGQALLEHLRPASAEGGLDLDEAAADALRLLGPAFSEAASQALAAGSEALSKVEEEATQLLQTEPESAGEMEEEEMSAGEAEALALIEGGDPPLPLGAETLLGGRPKAAPHNAELESEAVALLEAGPEQTVPAHEEAAQAAISLLGEVEPDSEDMARQALPISLPTTAQVEPSHPHPHGHPGSHHHPHPHPPAHHHHQSQNLFANPSELEASVLRLLGDVGGLDMETENADEDYSGELVSLDAFQHRHDARRSQCSFTYLSGIPLEIGSDSAHPIHRHSFSDTATLAILRSRPVNSREFMEAVRRMELACVRFCRSYLYRDEEECESILRVDATCLFFDRPFRDFRPLPTPYRVSYLGNAVCTPTPLPEPAVEVARQLSCRFQALRGRPHGARGAESLELVDLTEIPVEARADECAHLCFDYSPPLCRAAHLEGSICELFSSFFPETSERGGAGLYIFNILRCKASDQPAMRQRQ